MCYKLVCIYVCEAKLYNLSSCMYIIMYVTSVNTAVLSCFQLQIFPYEHRNTCCHIVLYHCIGVGSKFEVQRPSCATRIAAKKKSNSAVHSAGANFFKMSTFTLQNKAFFQWCIIFQSRSQTLTTLQYNIRKQITLTSSSFPGDRPASLKSALASSRAISLSRFRSLYIQCTLIGNVRHCQ